MRVSSIKQEGNLHINRVSASSTHAICNHQQINRTEKPREFHCKTGIFSRKQQKNLLGELQVFSSHHHSSPCMKSSFFWDI